MNYLQNLQIHLISISQTQDISIPESLETLRSDVSNAFLTLPQQWYLTYINTDNQEITLHSEQDFHDLLADALRTSSEIMIILIRERKNNSELAQDLEFQVIENIEESTGSQIDIFQHIANLRRQFESNKASQLSKDSVISAISQLVKAQSLNLNMNAAVRQPQRQEPNRKVPEGPLANLIIGESTLEDMFQRMINKNMLDIASKTANILQNRGFQPQNQPQAQEVHKDARCHECGISPIVGIKYKCLVCSDYELCEVCESAHDHVHALMKIKRPGQQYKLLQGGYSKAVSLVQSENFEVPVKHEEKPIEDEEEKSSILQKLGGGIKKSVKIALEPEVLEVIQEESKIEDNQVVEEEEKIDLGMEEKEEEKPAEISQDNLLVSQEVKKVYSENVIEKAKQLQVLLSGASLGELLEFVNNSQNNGDIVDLMEGFQKLLLESNIKRKENL